jgi:hypothetical protein
MVYSQSPPLVEKEWLTAAEELSPGGRARDPDARSDERIRPNKRPIHSPHSSSFRDGGRPSIGMRIFRTVTRFFIAVLIGVGATLAWQSHGDAAREMLLTRAPTLAPALAWLLPVSTTKSPVVAAITPDPAQQLGPLASNLDVVRSSVEQLAAKQEQMAQNIVALQAVEEDIRQKISPAPPPPAQPAASIPQPRQPQPRAQPMAAQSSSVPRPPPPAGSLPR